MELDQLIRQKLGGWGMSSDWTLQKISTLGEFDRGKSKHRPRDAKHLYGGPYPFIQTGDVTNADGRITSFRQTYSEAGLAQSRLWPAGTLAITIAANIAETALLTFPACFPDSVVGFTAHPQKADIRFVEYLFQAMRKQVKSHAYGSAQENINLEVLRKLEFPIPSLDMQTRIADFLSLLDDRISLLRASNATLEAIAQVLFKSWFVDFDPVHAKQQGRTPEGMTEATAALFPDGFEESELGLVPRGWRTGMFGDIADTVRKQISPTELHSGLHYVGLEHIPRQSLSLTDWDNAQGLESAKATFSEGDILFGKLRPYFHKVVIAPFDGVCSTDILVCRPKHAAYYGVITMHLFSVRLIEYANRLSNGAKMPRVNWKDIAAYAICIPPSTIADEYNKAVRPLFARMVANVHQIQTLATLRDTLLPRLISGQLRLPEAESQIEGALA